MIYDEKEKEFHGLILGQSLMDEFVTKFIYLLRCIPYIREENSKVKHFISSLPIFNKEKLKFDNPKTMDEAIWKAQILYQQMKQKWKAVRTSPTIEDK